MISASKALSSIEQAIHGIRREEGQLSKMLASVTQDASRLRAQQAEGYKALARLKLEKLARDDTVGTLDSAERAAVDALDRHKTLLAESSQAIAELTSEMQAAEKARDEAAEALKNAMESVEALADSTEAGLASDGAWDEAVRQVKLAEEMAAAAEEKATLAEADRDEKRKPYDADPLFTYLWKCGYGTGDYSAGRIARFFDSKISRLIDFDVARPNFYMLNEIPLRLRQHASRLEQASADRRTELEEFERRALEKNGVVTLESAAATAAEEHKKSDDAVEQLEEKLAAADKRHAALLAGTHDGGLKSALDGLTTAIAREDLASLYKDAQATKTPEDETIVRLLGELEPRIERLDLEAEKIRASAVDVARKRSELERSRDGFHRSGYSEPQGQFSNGPNVARVIAGIVEGALSSGALNDAFREGFSVPKSPRRGKFGGGLRVPPPKRRGGFRTGGGF